MKFYGLWLLGLFYGGPLCFDTMTEYVAASQAGCTAHSLSCTRDRYV